jgi:Type II secretion system (T2SS), protein M
MTTRDRLGLIGIGILALLAVGWFLVVSPQRKEASTVATQVAAAQKALAAAQSDVSSATQARERYSAAYASVVKLGKAVPPSEEVPSLIYQLEHATKNRHVEFNSITAGGGSGASTPSAPAAAATAGFTQMPFTFIFDGSFTDLYHVFNALNAATVRTTSGGLLVSGRLLTVQGVKLEHSGGVAQGSGSSDLTGTVTATAYVLPAGQGVTAGATASAPASTGATTAASSAPGSSSSPAAPVATIGPAR